MRRATLVLLCLFVAVAVNAQKIDLKAGEPTFGYDDLGKIIVAGKLKLKDIYRVDEDFKQLKPFGEPLESNYKDELLLERWTFKYPTFELEFVDRHAYIQIEKITFFASPGSNDRIAGVVLEKNVEMTQLIRAGQISKDSAITNKNLVKVGIYSSEGDYYRDVKLEVFKTKNKVDKIVVTWDTT